MAVSASDITRLRMAGQTAAPGWHRISARRSGKRPLAVVGRVLLEAQSGDTDSGAAHRIVVMETSDGGFAYTIEQQVKDAGTSFAVAETCASFDDVVSGLNAFDPARGLCVEVGLEGDASARLALVLRQCEVVRRDYQETLAQIVASTDARP